MKWMIAVLDPDSSYRDRFLKQWKTYPKEGVGLNWYDTPEAFAEVCRTRHVDAILVSPHLAGDALESVIQAILPPPILWYWREGNDAGDMEKYQPVSRIRQEILHRLSALPSHEPTVTRGGKLLFCTALSGGVGLSAIVQALAFTLKNHLPDKKIFIHAMQPFSLPECAIASVPTAQETYTLSDVVLSMRMPLSDVNMRLASCTVSRHGLDSIAAPKRAADFFEIREEEWVRLFETLKEREEWVLLDCPVGWLWRFPALLSVADRMLVIRHGESDQAVRLFLEALPYSWQDGKDALLDRKKRTPASTPLSGGASLLTDDTHFWLPFVAENEHASWERVVQVMQEQESLQEVVSWLLHS